MYLITGALKTFNKDNNNDNMIIIVAGPNAPPEIIRTYNGLSKYENALGISQESMRKK